MKDKFTPEDLRQLNKEYLERMRKCDLINLTFRLRNFSIELYELLNIDSNNSSKPPSSDNPYKKRTTTEETECAEPIDADTPGDDVEPDIDDKQPNQNDEAHNDAETKRQPGRQPGSQGFWRKQKPEPDFKEHHYPQNCIICGEKLSESAQPHMAHYTYELERKENGIVILCTLHYYYAAVCECGHENIEKPGEGYISVLDGRKRNVKLSEYTIVGPMLSAFIAALNRRSGMSRQKIQEHLRTWMNFDLSIGLICKSIREAGIACYPVVDELINDLQKEEHVHFDETPWFEKGLFRWLWVAISKRTAVYRIGTRKKDELLHLITEAFIGWLITDGYRAYRSYPHRQRCLAHLIRKAVRLTGAVDDEARKMGEWFLREMRGLLKTMAEGEDGRKQCGPILARFKKACNLGSKSDHARLKSFANEILNDWDAVVAFVKNPGLPATNNEAERALRWAVIFRKITFGTRTEEGSRSFSALLSVIETCRLRNIEPWEYIAQVIALARKGIAPLPMA